MPAPTVEMGLGGTWAAVAASHAPDAHVICDMRAYRTSTGVPRLRLSHPSVFATEYDGMTPTGVSDGYSGYADVTFNSASTLNLPSNLPGGGLYVALDGTNDYIAYGSVAGPGVLPFSLELVISVSAAPSAGEEIAVAGNDGFGLALHDDGRVYGYYNGSAVVDVALPTGALNHLALVRSGASTDVITLYLNGSSVDTASIARVSLTGGPYVWSCGIGWSVADYHACSVYGFALHGVALTSGMVSASYAALSWTDVTQDVLGSQSLVFERGIRDDRPSVRVASTGTLSFTLNNLASNSGGVTGYYSPGHASCRAGFGKGTSVRVKSGSDVVWLGRIRSVSPSPGRTGGGSKVFATDYLDMAAVSLMENIAVMESVTGDLVFTQVVGLVPATTNGVTTSVGTETYTLALDNTRDEAVSALAEFHRLAMSELGYIYQTRTGALVYENRSTRISSAGSPSFTLSDTMHGIDVAEVSSSSTNRVQVTTHPRVYDSAATTVLFALVNPMSIAAGEAKVIIGPFRAATATGITTRVGGLDMVTPVETTDYTMNTEADGSGADLTASMTVTAEYGPNGVRLNVTNGSVDAAYVTKLQCRGKGVYDFRTVVVRAQNDAAIASDGVNALTIDMPYQEDPNVGQALADLLLAGYGDLSGTRVRRVMLLPDAAGMPAGLWTADISTRVALSETVTGATGEYYLNGVKHEYQNGTLPRITWWLTPAEPVSYWLLDTSGASELDETTMLGAA